MDCVLLSQEWLQPCDRARILGEGESIHKRRSALLLRPDDGLELVDIACEPAFVAPDGATVLEQRQRCIDLGTAGADQERKLALRNGKVNDDRAAGFRLAVLAGSREEEARQTHFNGIERNTFELVVGFSNPMA